MPKPITFEELLALWQEWVDSYDEEDAHFAQHSGQRWTMESSPDEILIDGWVEPFPTWVRGRLRA